MGWSASVLRIKRSRVPWTRSVGLAISGLLSINDRAIV
jgi:hypothetical protein